MNQNQTKTQIYIKNYCEPNEERKKTMCNGWKLKWKIITPEQSAEKRIRCVECLYSKLTRVEMFALEIGPINTWFCFSLIIIINELSGCCHTVTLERAFPLILLLSLFLTLSLSLFQACSFTTFDVPAVVQKQLFSFHPCNRC